MDERIQSLVDDFVGKSEFRFPDVQPGDSVIYYRHPGGKTGYMGICMAREGTKDHCESISVLAYPPGAYSIDCYGVRHKDDPQNLVQVERAAENGVFELAPQTLRIQQLERDVYQIRRTLLSLRSDENPAGDEKPKRRSPGKNPLKDE